MLACHCYRLAHSLRKSSQRLAWMHTPRPLFNFMNNNFWWVDSSYIDLVLCHSDEDLEIELVEEEPPFLRGHTKQSMDMSPVKIVKVRPMQNIITRLAKYTEIRQLRPVHTVACVEACRRACLKLDQSHESPAPDTQAAVSLARACTGIWFDWLTLLQRLQKLNIAQLLQRATPAKLRFASHNAAKSDVAPFKVNGEAFNARRCVNEPSIRWRTVADKNRSVSV